MTNASVYVSAMLVVVGLGVALGVIVGVLALAFALMWMRRLISNLKSYHSTYT